MPVRRNQTSPQSLEIAMQAIVLSDDYTPPAFVLPPVVKQQQQQPAPEEYFFGVALQNVTARQNQRVGYEYVSLAVERPLEWSIMGTGFCEYILVRLDPSFTSFDVSCLLPQTGTIHWRFSKASIDKDIENALSALFV